MPKIELKHVTKRFGKFVAVDDLNMVIEDRSFVTLLGPSGCGKTTTLRMIAGLETPTEGEITINDRIVFSSEKGIDISADKRDVGFLFQNYALWPHMTVYKNIAFGLENLKWSKEDIKQRVEELLAMLKISEFSARYPSELSGGQQQRVAIARTLATGPKALFMDEPLSNLDAKLRMEMRTELKRLHRETDSTFVYVTHDQLEAMTLSSRVCLMKNGYMQQYAPPLEVYRKPANTFTADFVGSPNINLIKGEVTKLNPITLALPGSINLVFKPLETIGLSVGQKIILGLRPEHVAITEGPSMAEATVLSSLPSGMETIVQLRMGESYLHSVVFGDLDFDLEKQVGLSFASGKSNLFDEQSTVNLGQGLLSRA
ncbi:ABC transporter ATP-binding protein [Sphaerochaeta sp. PS]|uniref:ABC transporter ATP-binding protein n=1 Tax=Sphaerochaeta sp. PS TaxID=3076336 RepID=UPI0028A37241|nr:ABC transporter ATP-binding protein [Sphaerochaeta sp. PS]MDT4761403.1 ABC transporter ATP-binding protein [Sphaerochaeta sp. PS]